MTKKKLKLNIEDEVLERAAKELAARIDFSVMSGILVESGWTSVKVLGADVNEVEEWAKQNARDIYNHYDDEWVFKSKQDANWFKLRWDTEKPGSIL